MLWVLFSRQQYAILLMTQAIVMVFADTKDFIGIWVTLDTVQARMQ